MCCVYIYMYSCGHFWLHADWFGAATQNTTSFTPFKSAYMHFLIITVHPDSQVLLSASKQMEGALEGYATLYAYDNLSSDPYPGKHQSHHIYIVTSLLM